jgi:hypothetical protein
MEVRLSALRAGRPLPHERDSWYSFLLEDKSRLEGLGKQNQTFINEKVIHMRKNLEDQKFWGPSGQLGEQGMLDDP